MNNQLMSWNEMLIWINVLFLSILGFFNISVNLILVLWVISILINGQVKKIDSKKFVILFMLLRRSLYILPYLIPLLFKYRINFNISIITLGYCVIGFLSGLGLIIPKLKTWRLVLSYDFISFRNQENKVHYLSFVFLLIAAAIVEEFFYREFIISIINTSQNFMYISIFISIFMFMLHHIGTKWHAEFSKYDILIQAIFSVISCSLYLLSNSLLPSIVTHLVYNMPSVILNTKSYLYWYVLDKEKLHSQTS
ncbi:CPBP family glutamic-type intramembrane protease [Alkaliphilus hydrothermalis]|uniref:Membrane protease YdiL (CAAX protease family) n=1 Tax=Alkaliphilus hydrothermalis TaxID=1482730 RepID=A0ABS2NTE5_9FIRM|nr:CPBP family glutamic-type intramembrane protease [Alkaliphilus hydrothermalis]MBM7616201.1 membrane protease YdiL (CAAX protease family) [Alkaliphilus hydrothermalis]